MNRVWYAGFGSGGGCAGSYDSGKYGLTALSGNEYLAQAGAGYIASTYPTRRGLCQAEGHRTPEQAVAQAASQACVSHTYMIRASHIHIWFVYAWECQTGNVRAAPGIS